MGMTKDLVTGVWVGCDERTAHFKNGEQGEGSRTALPIFAKFMEKVYLDPTSGYTYGAFPKATVPITRTINCPSPRIVADTTTTDSVLVDSTDVNVPVVEEETTTPATSKEPEVKKEEKKPEPVQNQPETTAPLTKKEERELRRKKRQEEREKKQKENN